MRTLSNILTSDLEVADAVRLSGMACRNVVVASGGALEMSGMIAGDLIVRAGGVARVSGMVAGILRNEGGEVEISGMVRRLQEVAGTTVVSGLAGRSKRPAREAA